MKKFNFLDRRTARSKTEEVLRRQFPRRSAVWIHAKARHLAGTDDITVELRAPQPSCITVRRTK